MFPSHPREAMSEWRSPRQQSKRSPFVIRWGRAAVAPDASFPYLPISLSFTTATQFQPRHSSLKTLASRNSTIRGVVVAMAAMAAMATSSAAVVVSSLPAGLRSTGFATRHATVSIGWRTAADKVARKAIEVRAGIAPLSELEGSVKQAIRNVKDAASQSALMKQASFLAFNALMVLPALAEEVLEKEPEPKGKIFDFNLTLPIIAVQFLLLMLALDNIWFKPVAKVMDARDENIRSKLMGVRDNSGEIKKMQNEAESILKAARIETTEALSKTKRETAAMLDEKLQESRARIEKELAQSLSNMDEQKEDTLRSLDKQVQTLSEEILSKVIPFKV